MSPKVKEQGHEMSYKVKEQGHEMTHKVKGQAHESKKDNQFMASFLPYLKCYKSCVKAFISCSSLLGPMLSHMLCE